jgi:hypothetical protein
MGSLPNISQPFLSDSGLSDAISSDYADVRIIERIPARGMPPSGVPFSVRVQVQTYKTGGPALFRTPFACLDAFVAVRGLGKYNNQILGGGFVRTDAFSNCRGSATIQFDPVFRPGSDDYVQFELYPGGSTEWFSGQTTLQDVKDGKLEPIAISQRMRFSDDQKTLENAGIIQHEDQSNLFTMIQPAFADVRKTLLTVTALAAVGVTGYFLVLNSGAVRQVVKKAANR